MQITSLWSKHTWFRRTISTLVIVLAVCIVILLSIAYVYMPPEDRTHTPDMEKETPRTAKNAHTLKELRTLAETAQLALQIVDLDVTEDASVKQAIEYVVRTANRLDVIVNNAGVSYTGPIEAFTLEQVQQQFDTNIFGVIRLASGRRASQSLYQHCRVMNEAL